MNTPPLTDGLSVQSQHVSSDSATPDRRSPSVSTRPSIDNRKAEELDATDPKKVILEAYFPRVFVLPSADTEELIRLKGIYGGLAGLLRPFGERIQGNVVTRDSSGASKNLVDYGVHFIPFHKNTWKDNQKAPVAWQDDVVQSTIDVSSRLQPQLAIIDDVLNFALRDSEKDAHSEIYPLFLRKLLAGRSLIPHETYTHPVACLIAISSQCPSPIETLRDLYDSTRLGSRELPPWLSNEFLRYYVLVHDEDHDDIAKSTALFDQMKRHFGLHCHMLRIKSVECGPHTEEGTQLPDCKWLPVSEDLNDLKRKEQDSGVDEFKQYLFDTDITMIKTFVREMVTQSIIPFMEGRITAWNEHVASRRRGISGRFMSLSKRWTGFGANRGSKSSPSTNFNTTLGAYLPDSSEATIHRLADYAFMLNDWKLASSTYDLLRADFTDDKAWRHSSIANEMAASSWLLWAQSSPSALKTETIDQMLDAASYSYLSRCSDPLGALRCLLLAVELYKVHGRAGVKEAAKWADRLLELSILSPLAQCLLSERLALFFQLYPGSGDLQWGSQKRRAALWSFLAADLWLSQSKPSNAKVCLSNAKMLYSDAKNNTIPFQTMEMKWNRLNEKLVTLDKNTSVSYDDPAEDEELDEVQEELHDHSEAKKASKRLSVGLHPPQADVINLFQRLNDPLDQTDDGFS
jgi:trafficking protein particle complex subunit 8